MQKSEMATCTQTGKALYVHAGGTKTGPSALQNVLEMERDKLRQFELSYENRCGIKTVHEITSGNGSRLLELLRDRKSTDDDLGRLILSYFNGTRRAICSCEGLEDLDQKTWTRFVRLTRDLNVHLEIIFYVRDVIPFLGSGYDQVIKRHGEYRPFAQWVGQADWNHGLALKRMAAEIAVHNIHVMHYEEGTRSVVEKFLNVFELDATFNVEPLYKDAQVNRSLTKRERETLKFANSVLGETYGRDLSDLLIYSNPNATSEPVFVSKRMSKLILDRFASDVKWVNATFFNGRDVVSVLAPEKVTDRKATSFKSWNPLERNVSDKLSYIWAVNKLGTTKTDVERLTLDKLNSAAVRYGGRPHPDLPGDFNVLAYLAMNPDVLFSGVDPIQHYLVNGRAEGRLYKYGSANTASAEGQS
jgi:hypothetical protein